MMKLLVALVFTALLGVGLLGCQAHHSQHVAAARGGEQRLLLLGPNWSR
jgi:hypothetical protein